MIDPGISPARTIRFVVGDGVGSIFRLRHAFGTQYVIVQVMQSHPPYQPVPATVERTSPTEVTVGFVDYVPRQGECIVVIVG